MAPSCWAFFLKFCPKLSWADECGGVMEGIMLGGENNMLRPAPDRKFVPSYDKNRDMARWAQNLGQYGQIEKIRSEEHTSELQSHSDLVCRLLLEKKNENVVAHGTRLDTAPTIAHQMN